VGGGDGAARRQGLAPELPVSTDVVSDAPASVPDHSEALAEISRNQHAALVRFLTVRTGSAEDAKEIVQEAYAKMLALDRPAGIGVVAGYLWRVAVNLAIDRKRHHVLHERFRRAAAPAAERQEFSAESIVEARERLAIVERAIGELPPRCLEAFVLHVLKGLTFDEVGREMGISDRMAKKHVARALEYLQTCLDAANETGSSR
jgi:RNA polymerase sigma factor (sigma-70 family)